MVFVFWVLCVLIAVACVVVEVSGWDVKAALVAFFSLTVFGALWMFFTVDEVEGHEVVELAAFADGGFVNVTDEGVEVLVKDDGSAGSDVWVFDDTDVVFVDVNDVDEYSAPSLVTYTSQIKLPSYWGLGGFLDGAVKVTGHDLVVPASEVP